MRERITIPVEQLRTGDWWVTRSGERVRITGVSTDERFVRVALGREHFMLRRGYKATVEREVSGAY